MNTNINKKRIQVTISECDYGNPNLMNYDDHEIIFMNMNINMNMDNECIIYDSN